MSNTHFSRIVVLYFIVVSVIFSRTYSFDQDQKRRKLHNYNSCVCLLTAFFVHLYVAHHTYAVRPFEYSAALSQATLASAFTAWHAACVERDSGPR